MATAACFMIVSKNDIPIYEAEVGTSPRVFLIPFRRIFSLHLNLNTTFSCVFHRLFSYQ